MQMGRLHPYTPCHRNSINKTLPHFGDVVVMHHAFKKPPSFENRGTTGVCLGHDSRIAGGVLVVSVVNGELKEVCSAKVRTLGEKVGQAWRLHVHPQGTTKAAYVNRKGEVKWSLHEIEVPTVEQCVKEDALEVQDIRELGLGWAWFMNDLRAFLPAWQEMELASPSPDAHRTPSLVYERPLAVAPFGTLEVVPGWQDTYAMHAFLGDRCLGQWIRTGLGVRTFQGLGRNGPTREKVVRRITKDLHTRHVLEDLLCHSHPQVPLHRRCLPDCGPTMSHSRDFQTIFVYRLFPRFHGPAVLLLGLRPSHFPSGGGGGSASFSRLASMFEDTSVRSTLSHHVKDTRPGDRHATLNQEAIKALRELIKDFENQLQCQSEVDEDVTSDEVEEEEPPQELAVNSTVLVPDEENDEVPLPKEPQLYLCDDWIQPMAIISKPRELTAKDKVKANVAKNCLIVTLMSLELGYGSILERYQQEGDSLAQRYEQPRSETRPTWNSVLLTDEEFLARRDEHLEIDASPRCHFSDASSH